MMKKVILSLCLFLVFSPCLHAQWTTGTANNIYTTTAANNVVIGGALPSTINASSLLFPASIPKMEIITGAVSTAYSDVVTLRHTGLAADLLSRQMGLVFKLSGEGTAIESNKMGGILVESSNGYANYPSLSLLTANARRLTVDFNGNVGVGTTLPNTKLDVNGVISMNGFGYVSSIRGDANNYTNLFLGGAIKDNGNGTYTAFGDGGSNYFSAIRMDNGSVNNAGAINFYDGISVSGANYTISNANLASYLRMTISGNGNIGIGIAAPQNKLDVNGTVHAKQVNIDLNGWNDYVFKKDYQLMPLSEIKAYIDQNQHLPEIPSEQEMVKNGLNVGEMNRLLMKKVEELTLYLIEKDKQVVELEKRLSQLEIKSKN